MKGASSKGFVGAASKGFGLGLRGVWQGLSQSSAGLGMKTPQSAAGSGLCRGSGKPGLLASGEVPEEEERESSIVGNSEVQMIAQSSLVGLECWCLDVSVQDRSANI